MIPEGIDAFAKVSLALKGSSEQHVRGESTLIHESTLIYFRDVYDHTIEIIDMIEG